MTKIGARAKHSFVGLLLALALAAGLLVSASPAQAQVGCGDPNVLDLDKTAAPDPVRVGQRLTFTLTETNNTPCPGFVIVEDDLPTGVRFVSVTTDYGECEYDPSSNAIGCILILPGNSPATVDIVVVPTAPGTITNAASDIFGNQAQVTVTVIEPTPTPTPNPTPPPSPQPQPAPIQRGGEPQPAPIQQGGEQEAESGDVDQSFDVVG